MFSRLCRLEERPWRSIWKKEESERLGGDGDQIKFIDLKFERWQILGFRKVRRRQHYSLRSALHYHLRHGEMTLNGQRYDLRPLELSSLLILAIKCGNVYCEK